MHHQRSGIGNFWRVPYDNRIVAAHLERKDLVWPGGELAVDRDAGMRRSGKQHPVDAIVRDQRLPFFGPAHQKLDHRGGNSGAVEAAAQKFADRRCLFTRLEHHHVTRDQRRDDVAVGQMGGEIKRAQYGHNPVRFVPHRHGALHRIVEFSLRSTFSICADRDFGLADHRFHFAARFPQRLAGFAGDQFGKGIVFLAHFIGEAAHQFHAGGERLRGPGRPCAACAADDIVDVAARTTP